MPGKDMIGSRGNRTSNTLAAATLAAALSAGVVAAPAAPARAAGLDAVQYFTAVTFPSGSQSAIGSAITPVTPAKDVFVIQTVSIYRFPASTSTLQGFIGVTYGGRTGYYALPDVASATDFYPATTMNLTAYVTAGTSAFVNLYRTGGSGFPGETDYITVTGYITPGS